jgi:hypothetical protein
MFCNSCATLSVTRFFTVAVVMALLGFGSIPVAASQRAVAAELLQWSYIDRARTKKQLETKDDSMQQSMVPDKESSNQHCWLQD